MSDQQQQQQMWQFGIDVGGTFTDLIARSSAGELRSHKTLSSGKIKGRIESQLDATSLYDPRRRNEPDHLWRGYQLEWQAAPESCPFRTLITDSAASGHLWLADPLPAQTPHQNYELFSHEAAPVVGIRYVLGKELKDTLPPLQVRLGTTRGTNALLERRGGRCAFITTAGFEDCLSIGNQARSRLFDLAISKSPPLYDRVVGIHERIDASGRVLISPQTDVIQSMLAELRATGITSIAICLLHAYCNPIHEQLLEQLALQAGFQEISVSSRVSPLIKFISRGDTTLLNAYLNPVLQDYLTSIQESLPGSQLQLMTSSGGLVSATQFQGKDSILSGPAGGVVGYAEAAQRAGFRQAIGFDMGGTSTDVSRYAGAYELTYETEKAGVRIAAPLLNIETVAAGGGSICRFDGVRLLVGPESAGADPGPCCYGKNGPLTVTDMNVFTGRILPEHFPFALDLSAVEQKLQQLSQEMTKANSQVKLTPHQLAEGFLQIANARMARAIRKVSSSKGYHPADHVLVTFGGAGGLHACALARELGMSQILIPPLAGVLSAYGIGQAEIRHHAEQAVLKNLEELSPQEIHSLFAKLQQQAEEKFRQAENSHSLQLTHCHSLDLRYRGRDSVLNIAGSETASFRESYEQEHQRLFGFVDARQPIEVVAARVQVASLPTNESFLPVAQKTAESLGRSNLTQLGSVNQTTPLYWNGQLQQVPLLQRETLSVGYHLAGPAVICAETATIFVEPEFQLQILKQGELLLQKTQQTSPSTPVDCSPLSETNSDDPVRLEIFHQQFASIAEQMGETLRQTARSVNVKERLDYSCAVFDAAGELVANAPHIPVHLGAMSETVQSILADNPHMSHGDVFVTNDPYRGGSHLPDVTVVSPLILPDTNTVLAFVASRAHHAEIGGITPGSMPPFSKTLAEEGVVIRNFRLFHQGKEHFSDLQNLLLTGPWPSRNVADNLADLHAQLAANQQGLHLLQALIANHSLPRVQHFMQQIRQASAAKMRQTLSALPDGQYQFTDHLDDGSPITVSITIQHDHAHIDFSGTGPVLPTNLNANRAIVTAAVMYVLRCLIAADTPLNGGLLEPVTIHLPECLLNPPAQEHPADCAAMVGGNVETSQRVVDVLLGALQLAAGSQGTMNNLTFGNSSFGYYETICGGSGATAEHPGCDAVHTHMTNTRLTDVEVLESRYPVRLRQFRIRKNSGGAGEQRGGNGIIREIEFLEPLQVSMLSQRRGQWSPFGLNAGQAGQSGLNEMQKAGSLEWVNLGGSFQIPVQPGDALRIQTPGGGGWGASKSHTHG